MAPKPRKRDRLLDLLPKPVELLVRSPSPTPSTLSAKETKEHALGPTATLPSGNKDSGSALLADKSNVLAQNVTQRTSPFIEAGQTVWSGTKAFAGALAGCGAEFGPLRSAIEVFIACVETFEAKGEVQEKYKSLRATLDWLFHDLADRFGADIPPGMRPSIVNLARGLERELLFVRLEQHQQVSKGYTGAQEDLDKILKCYLRMQSLLERLALNANVNVWMKVEEQTTRYLLDRLSPSHAAWYNSKESKEIYRDECTPDTRLEVLERFRVWRDDNTVEKIYWLNGMAGTGKTTLSYTLCKQLDSENRLAANFFCSRLLSTCRDAHLILPTIAYQLANFSYPFRYALSEILEKNPDVHTREIQEQFSKLLVDPIHQTRHTFPENLVIVIEGLDECQNPSGVGGILDLLLANMTNLPVKFFLTSRPEPEIRQRMCHRSGKRERFELHLHDLDRSIVREDIRRYLQCGLKPANVGSQDLETLVEHSGVLFIYAATIVRLILDQAINDRRLEKKEKDEMVLVLHTVICAQEPMTAHTLSILLGLGGEAAVKVAVDALRSVLNVEQSGEGITTLHKSFSDYLFHPDRAHQFHCNAAKHNQVVAQGCLRRIRTHESPFNICSLASSYVFDKDILDLPKKVEQCIPRDLLYACRYWAIHTELAERSQGVLDDVYGLLSERLLLYIEVLNLTDYLRYSGANHLSRVIGWIKEFPRDHRLFELALELATDAYHFMSTFASSPASRSTAHLYVSALRFWPPEKPVSKRYSRYIRYPAHDTSQVIGESHSTLPIYAMSGVYDSAFFPDASRVISGSANRMVDTWDAPSSATTRLRLGHMKAMHSVSYSPAGRRIVCGSEDKTVQVWNADTGEPATELVTGRSDAVCSVVYSPDGHHISTGLEDGIVRVWNADTGAPAGKSLHGHTDAVYSVSYSHDGHRIVSGSLDNTIRIWDADTGAPVGEPLQGHVDAVYSVSYSHDGHRIVSGSWDNTIRIWDADTGAPVGDPLVGHSGAVCSVSYSPNSRRIVSGSQNGSIRVWDADTGALVTELLHEHTVAVRSVTYSPDGHHIASGLEDGTVRVWDITHDQSVAALLATSISKCARPSEDGCLESLAHDHASSLVPLDLSAKRSPNTTKSMCCSWAIDEDGWIVTCSSQRLLWVPADVRGRIHHPLDPPSILGEETSLIELRSMLVGERWAQLYQPPQDDMVNQPPQDEVAVSVSSDQLPEDEVLLQPLQNELVDQPPQDEVAHPAQDQAVTSSSPDLSVYFEIIISIIFHYFAILRLLYYACKAILSGDKVRVVSKGSG